MLASLDKVIVENVDQLVKESPVVGVIADESIDIAIFKKLVLYVAIIVEGELKVYLARLEDVPDGKGCYYSQSHHKLAWGKWHSSMKSCQIWQRWSCCYDEWVHNFFKIDSDYSHQ